MLKNIFILLVFALLLSGCVSKKLVYHKYIKTEFFKHDKYRYYQGEVGTKFINMTEKGVISNEFYLAEDSLDILIIVTGIDTINIPKRFNVDSQNIIFEVNQDIPIFFNTNVLENINVTNNLLQLDYYNIGERERLTLFYNLETRRPLKLINFMVVNKSFVPMYYVDFVFKDKNCEIILDYHGEFEIRNK
jgi:hypothetical protein